MSTLEPIDPAPLGSARRVPSADAPDFGSVSDDDLTAARAEAWRMLALAAADRRAPMHAISVATAGADGAPKVRIVVLRKADGGTWRVRFHADARTEKMQELRADPRIALVGYDPAAKAQIRLEGVARLHVGDDLATIAWTASRPMSRVGYRIAPAPGCVIPEGGAYVVEDGDDASGFENFAVVDVAVARLDWLRLAHTGNRRARFERDGRMAWLTP